MPIRSDRGRNATLRALATWPLHSPRRLVGICTALAVLCAGITLTITTTSTTRATPSTSTTLAPPERSSTTSQSHSHAPAVSSPHPIIAGDPAAVSARFAEAWVAKLDPPAWRERLAPLCTDEFRATALAATDPSQITASAITGQTTLNSNTGRAATTSVPLDTAQLALSLQDITGSGDWRIADARPGR